MFTATRWVLTFLAGATAALAEEDALLWKLYRTQDGLVESAALSVRISPRGNVCVAQGPTGAVWMDGYRIRQLRPGAAGGHPIYESRSGQIFAVHPEGIQEYLRDGWIVHPVEAVQSEREASPLKLLRDMPILPAERDRVLILLPGQLLRSDISQSRSTVVRRVEETGLERFTDIMEARDGGVWVMGSRGVAKVNAPVRRLASETPWAVSLLPESLGLRIVGRAFEDDSGGMVAVAAAQPEGARVLVRWDGMRWLEPLPAPPDVRAGWSGPGGVYWAQSRLRLYRLSDAEWETVVIPGLDRPQLLDVAVEPGGVFWLATSQGLVRHAPRPWQVPRGLQGETDPVRTISESPDGRVWFSGLEGVLTFAAGRWQSWRFPPALKPVVPSRTAWLKGRLVIADSGRRLLALDPEAGQFSEVAPPENRVLRGLIGRLSDGRWVVPMTAAGDRDRVVLQAYDGDEFSDFSGSLEMASLPAAIQLVQDRRNDQRWVGTSEGLAVWNERTRSLTRATEPSFGQIRSLVETPPGRLWCLTDAGLFEGDGRAWSMVRRFPTEVRRLASLRDGSIWAVGETNLFRYGNGVWLQHATPEGLPAAPLWDVWLDERGELWAATEAGVRQYDRESDNDAPLSQATGLGGRTQFSTRARATLIFSGQDRWDYTPASRLLYATRMDQGPWSAYATGGVFVLTNLTAGEHQFAVRAMDPSLNEQMEPAVLDFSAFVPWHAEPRLVGVLTAAFLLVAGLAGLAVNRHLRLVRSYAEVERIVTERTRQLERANEELLHSQKMRALGTLAAGIAHDFNSILSIIKGSAQIIEANLDDREKIRLRLDRIRKMVDQGAGIVRTMLGLSRSSRLEWRQVDLGPFLEETARLMSDQWPPGLSVRVDSAAGLPPVRIAPDMVRQVLLNLLFNAADAMAGRGEIELRARLGGALPSTMVLAPAGAPPFLVLEVVDRGHGIEPDVLPRIFEPFFTTKAFSTRKGTGLGLTMVYEIARETGLGLHVASAPGLGSTFGVFLATRRGPEAGDDAAGTSDA